MISVSAVLLLLHVQAQPTSLGEFKLTQYWISEQPQEDQPETPLLRKDCTEIASVSHQFERSLKMEGTGRLTDGRLLNVNGYALCQGVRVRAFSVVSPRKAPYGLGARGYVLKPYKTIAVDPKHIPLGTWVYIPNLAGRAFPGHGIHNGCVQAADVGGGIKGKQIDIFVERRANAKKLYRQPYVTVLTKCKETRMPSAQARLQKRVRVDRVFTKNFSDEGAGSGTLLEQLYRSIDWEKRDIILRDAKKKIIFEQRGVEVPTSWTQNAVIVVAQKYFRGGLGSPERESSVWDMVRRVVQAIATQGLAQGVLDDAVAFEAELAYLLIHQHVSFNSPVWFNVGVHDRPQCSACFIQPVEDSMESILDLAKAEGMLFKYGSGTGSNLSQLRSSIESLTGGGTASGPVSFMRGLDAFAGVIKSGGTTRRAAKMVILDIDHPDVVSFIECKRIEEQKAWALIDAGYDGSFNVPGGAYDSVGFQNANHSVRVSDGFMEAVERDGMWHTRLVSTGEVAGEYRARDLMWKIAEAAHLCGDPGMQYDTTINDWHTCAETARIRASNPCSEFMFLDNTACNLASFNLRKFVRFDGSFDVDRFEAAVTTLITAMELLVDFSSYPTQPIGEQTRKFRPLGLGFANLGALLMEQALPYDSEAGRELAASITALMAGAAYVQSAELARCRGPFDGYEVNKEPMMRVIRQHEKEALLLNPSPISKQAKLLWGKAVELGERYGFRNSQTTVLAPTGTTAFMMDCDTTGCEPAVALTAFKRLVGGGTFHLVNSCVAAALVKLDYSSSQVEEILAYLKDQDTIEGAPHLEDMHLPIFDCAFTPRNGKRSIPHHGHLQMMAAMQPFLSGAISKTVNLPKQSTVQDFLDVYMKAWKLGLKSVALYRDGSKRTQPLSNDPVKPQMQASPKEVQEVKHQSRRRRLPDTRPAINHKFEIGGHEGYVNIGLYPDTQEPGELFLKVAKEGSVVAGLLDAIGIAISLGRQYGVPLEALCNKFKGTRFEPAGVTSNPDIRITTSIMDYLARFLEKKFLDPKPSHLLGLTLGAEPESGSEIPLAASGVFSLDAPMCQECGSLMEPNGSCFGCRSCGATSGCS